MVHNGRQLTSVQGPFSLEECSRWSDRSKTARALLQSPLVYPERSRARPIQMTWPSTEAPGGRNILLGLHGGIVGVICGCQQLFSTKAPCRHGPLCIVSEHFSWRKVFRRVFLVAVHGCQAYVWLVLALAFVSGGWIGGVEMPQRLMRSHARALRESDISRVFLRTMLMFNKSSTEGADPEPSKHFAR